MAAILSSQKQNLRCFVIGNGPIALSCVKTLGAAGYTIVAVYSFDGALKAWADDERVVHSSSRKAFKECMQNQPFEFLFSINNPWIIPPEILSLPLRRAINFHDSPLPKYAGLNATSWALINGETHHATTWHIIDASIDTGQILKQVRFSITDDDTAISVNRRVLELTIQAFSELLKELSMGTEVPVDQPSGGGSYYSGKDRPNAACSLSFMQSYKQNHNLVRGLDFGPVYNPLGRPKLMLANGPIIVSSMRRVCTSPSKTPGQILEVTDEGLTLSFVDADVLLTGLCRLSGEALGVKGLRKFGCREGQCLPKISEASRQELSAYDSEARAEESFWIARLSNLKPYAHPYVCSHKKVKSGWRSLSKLQDYANSFIDYFAIIAGYLARLCNEDSFNVGYVIDNQSDLVRQFFASVIPLEIASANTSKLSFDDFKKQFEIELDRCCNARIALDVLARHPHLQSFTDWPDLPITLSLWDTPNAINESRIKGQLGFFCFRDASPPELFYRGHIDQWQLESMTNQLEAFAKECKKNGLQPLNQISLLFPHERTQILEQWNNTQASYPDQESVDSLISRQALATPNAVAVKCGEKSISYQQLEVRANQIANEIRRRGDFTGKPIILCLPRCVDLVATLVAIIKAGAAYLPVDPKNPSERVKAIADDSGATCVITLLELQDKFHFDIDCVIALDTLKEPLRPQEAPHIESRRHGDSLLYIIYTSGSTGKPKGVKISHRSLINHSWFMSNKYRLGTSDRVLQSASIGFDVAAEQIFPALFSGSAVVIRPDDLLESFSRFETFIQNNEITVAILPTAFWHEWVLDLTTEKRFIPATLRLIAVGTEKVLSDRLDDFVQQCRQQVDFYQGYGPTETTITCTMYSHNNESRFKQREIPIGKPLPNVRLYVLDRNLQPVPIGIPGELFVGGDGVALGYHHQEALTDKCFIANPFKAEGNERLYGTGDVVKWTRDGQLVYIERNDFQVKIRGMRIEVAEIEALLANHDCVKQAICKAIDHGRRGKILVAYATLHSPGVSEAELSAHLKARLPSYMVPAHIILLSAFPYTHNGKLDLRALPLPEMDKQRAAKDSPQSNIEKNLAALWQDMLGVERVYLDDDFFDLGGDSLLSIRMVDYINRHICPEIGYSKILSASSLFGHSTIRKLLAHLLNNTQESIVKSSIIPIKEANKAPTLYFVNSTQEAKKIAEYLAPNWGMHSLNIFTQCLRLGEGKSIDLIRDLAQIMADDVSHHQPEGNIRLIGYCQDGLLTVEIANALMQKKRVVDFIGLYDVIFFDESGIPLTQRIDIALDLGGKYLIDKATFLWLRVNKRIKKLFSAISTEKSQVVEDIVQLDKKFYNDYLQSIRSGCPHVFDGQVDLFLSREFRAKNLDGTRSIALGGLNIHQSMTAHHDIFSPAHIQSTAGFLSTLVLARAEKHHQDKSTHMQDDNPKKAGLMESSVG